MTASRKEIARRLEQFQRAQAEHIAVHGRTLVGVFATQDSKDPVNDAFVYTIGNAGKHLPELLIVGLHDDRGILNALSEEMIRRGQPFDDGEVFRFSPETKPVAIFDADDGVKHRYTCQASHWNGGPDSYRVQQVVLSDKDGRLPWEPGCAEPYSKVVVHKKERR